MIGVVVQYEKHTRNRNGIPNGTLGRNHAAENRERVEHNKILCAGRNARKPVIKIHIKLSVLRLSDIFSILIYISIVSTVKSAS